MSLEEEAQRLKQIPLPLDAVREAAYQLSQSINTVSDIVGQNASGARELMGALQQARAQLDAAFEMLQVASNVVEVVADRHLQG